MSRLYEAMRRIEQERGTGTAAETGQPAAPLAPAVTVPPEMPELLKNMRPAALDLRGARPARVEVSAASRLVAITEPRSLGADKFRSLATRLTNLRRERELKSIQVTSGIVGEGKSLVSVNLALTFAIESASKVLLVEGDMHRPSLPARLGLSQLTGINQWWEKTDQQPITQFLYKLNNWPLWLLAAGGTSDQPSQILQSGRFAEAFLKLSGAFDWVIVDSTPMLPTVDANLWSRLVDGTLLVVREGVAFVNALKKGLQSLDNPKLVGIVLNEASEFDRANYEDQYYAIQTTGSETVISSAE
jgi:capsular exopolysaccharide synthesis family protein